MTGCVHDPRDYPEQTLSNLVNSNMDIDYTGFILSKSSEYRWPSFSKHIVTLYGRSSRLDPNTKTLMQLFDHTANSILVESGGNLICGNVEGFRVVLVYEYAQFHIPFAKDTGVVLDRSDINLEATRVFNRFDFTHPKDNQSSHSVLFGDAVIFIECKRESMPESIKM